MPLQIDAFNKLIKVTSPTTAVSAQELHDFVEDYMATPVGMANDSGDPSFFGDILKPEGKVVDPTNPTQATIIVLVLNSEWQVQFWQGSGYTRLFGGKLIGGVNDQPFKATGAAGDITVLESPVDGTTTIVTSGSGLDETQDNNLTFIRGQLEAVEGAWDHNMVSRLVLAVLAGRMSGPPPGQAGTVVIRDIANSKDRLQVPVDANGYRTGPIVYDTSP